MAEVKELYDKRQYKQCSARCKELFDNVKDSVSSFSSQNLLCSVGAEIYSRIEYCYENANLLVDIYLYWTFKLVRNRDLCLLILPNPNFI